MYMVWTHGRQDQDNGTAHQNWSKDYRDLFSMHPNNTFLIKVAHWLNR
jgi:hypothetical protein